MKSDWAEKRNTLEKMFVFENFNKALEFVNKIGVVAEKLGHHPDVCIKNYKEVCVSTTTHCNGNIVTEKDIMLANTIDSLV